MKNNPKLQASTEREIKLHLSSITSSINSLKEIKFTFEELERMNDFPLWVRSIQDHVENIYDDIEEEVE